MTRDEELIALQYASNVLQGLLDQVCGHCSGRDVREAIQMRKLKLDNEIQLRDGQDNRPDEGI